MDEKIDFIYYYYFRRSLREPSDDEINRALVRYKQLYDDGE